MEPKRNQVICPTCGEVRLETPPGTTVLPTLGAARKAAMGAAGLCDCGKGPREHRRADDGAGAGDEAGEG
jgi:hypothetical protein